MKVKGKGKMIKLEEDKSIKTILGVKKNAPQLSQL
jgi:hypothetical protein